jgi:hypothetical protein
LDIDVPSFDLDDAPGLVDLIEEKFLRGEKAPRVRLKVNGKEIPLSPFVQSSIIGTVRGMVSSLRGCESPRTISLDILPDV